MQSANTWTTTPMVFVGLGILRAIALTAKAKLRSGNLVFNVPLIYRAMLIAFIGLPVIFQFLPDNTLWTTAAAAAMSVGAAFMWPATFIVTADSLQYRIWWRRLKIIPWKDIVDIEENSAGDISVYTQSGTLRFSRFHDDPSRFRHEVLSHAKLKGISTPELITGLRLG